MSQLIADCPRCNATKTAFDLQSHTLVDIQYDWQHWHEAFCVCRHCHKSTVFVVSEKGIDEHKAVAKLGLASVPGSANDFVRVERYISARDRPATRAPDFLPIAIKAAFDEGATCLSVNCFNAAGTMFRLSVDHATAEILPEVDADGLNFKIRRSLGLRLAWLFDHGRLPEAMRDLSHCIKEDGNDGAHAGTLGRPDAEDLLDFTVALLERLYTEPKRIQEAKERREARRNPAA